MLPSSDLSPQTLRIALAWSSSPQSHAVLLGDLANLGHDSVLVSLDLHAKSACRCDEELQAGQHVRRVRLGEQATEAERRQHLARAVQDCDLLHAIPSGDTPPYWLAEVALEIPTIVHLEALPPADQDPTLWQMILQRAHRIVFTSRADVVHAADRWRLDAAKTELLMPASSRSGAAARRWEGLGPLRVFHRATADDAKGAVQWEFLLQSLAGLPAGSVQVITAGGGEAVGDAPRGRGHRVPITRVARQDRGAIAALARTCHVAAYPGPPHSALDAAVEEALGWGLPVMTSGGIPSLECHGAASIQSLPVDDPEAWSRAFAHHLEDGSALREAFDGLPVTMVGSQAAAERYAELYRRVIDPQAAPISPRP